MRDPKEQELFTDLTMLYPHVREVANGNRGALSLVMRLQHRTKWSDMVKWLALNGYCGDMLWVLYKDVFREDFYAMGDFIVYMVNSGHWRDCHGDAHLEIANLVWRLLENFPF
jgi:hypothetical protein